MSLLWTCRDVIPLLTEYEEGTLSWYGRLRMRLHLLVCPACRFLYQELKEVPPLVDQVSQAPSPETKAMAEAALRGVLARIGEGTHKEPRPAAGPLPQDIQRLMGDQPDLTLRLLESVHLAFAQGQGPTQAPYLPPSVLSQLPDPERWTWHRRGTARVATLVPAGPGQAFLFITYRRGEQWTAPRALEPTVEGLEARLSPDLKTLYYSAEAPSGEGGMPAGGAVSSHIYQMPLERHLQEKAR